MSSSFSIGFASIAAQIEDRALLLASERGLRDVAEAERDQLQAVLDKESKTNAIIRRTLLQEVRSRHGVELELFRIQQQEEERERSIEKLEQETEDLRVEAEELEESWKQQVKEIYAPHQAKRSLYQKILESRIYKRQRKIKLRQDKIDFLERRAREMQADEQEMLSQMERIEQETNDANSREQEEDEAVSSLAMQIKATLAKVCIVCLCFCFFKSLH
jgi:chromosome segregation ATPase